MRKWLPAMGVVALLVAALGVVVVLSRSGPEEVRVGVFQIADHPALDKLREGFKKSVAESGWAASGRVTFDYKNANGDGTRIESIAAYFSSSDCKLVYTIGTACAQSLKAKNADMPIVLGAATDPVSAGLVASWEKPGGSITGTTDLPPVEDQLAVLREIVPRASRIGVVYNTGEDNSVAAVSRLKRAASSTGYKVVEKAVVSPAEVGSAVASLSGSVDVVYAPTDNTVQSGFAALVRGALDMKVPVFNCDIDSVKKGALFSVGIDYFDIGVVSGEMAVEVLQGADPGNMAIRSGTPHLYINLEAARRLGVEIPEATKARARDVMR